MRNGHVRQVGARRLGAGRHVLISRLRYASLRVWEDFGVITEQAVLDVRPGQERDFESAFAEAKALIASMPGFESLQLHGCVEKSNRYLLLVVWRRLEDHTEGFRGSAKYEEWCRLLHHYYDPFPTVEHFSLIATA
jgi:heme-degrading monooxygenase HmoA